MHASYLNQGASSYGPGGRVYRVSSRGGSQGIHTEGKVGFGCSFAGALTLGVIC